MPKLTQSIVLSTMVLLLVNACSPSKNETVNKKIYQVQTYTVNTQTVPLELSLNGKVRAFAKADVRPQVSGIITKRVFHEGQSVVKGEPLYQIDDTKYQAQYDLAKASLQKSSTVRQEAYKKLLRYQELRRKNSISIQEYDDVNLSYQSALSDEQIAKSNLTTAKNELDYTKVFAPISGIVGKSSVTAGSLVTANQSEVLTTIIDLSKVYVDVQQSASSYREIKQKIINGHLDNASSKKVQLFFDDGSCYPILGNLSLSEIQVDEDSGSVTLRAIFDNPDNLLLPGMSVSTKLIGALENNVMLIPSSALQSLANGKSYVFIVGKDNILTRQEVSVGNITKDGWVINSGLKTGDVIVSSLVGTLKSGDKVKIVNGADK